MLAAALVLCCAVGATGIALFPTHAQVIPTATTQPIISMQPATTPNTPTLGGTVGDFQRRYGAAIDSSGLMYAATIADQRVLMTLTVDERRATRIARRSVRSAQMRMRSRGSSTTLLSTLLSSLPPNRNNHCSLRMLRMLIESLA